MTESTAILIMACTVLFLSVLLAWQQHRRNARRWADLDRRNPIPNGKWWLDRIPDRGTGHDTILLTPEQYRALPRRYPDTFYIITTDPEARLNRPPVWHIDDLITDGPASGFIGPDSTLEGDNHARRE